MGRFCLHWKQRQFLRVLCSYVCFLNDQHTLLFQECILQFLHLVCGLNLSNQLEALLDFSVTYFSSPEGLQEEKVTTLNGLHVLTDEEIQKIFYVKYMQFVSQGREDTLKFADFFSPLVGSSPQVLRRRRNVSPSGFHSWSNKEQQGSQQGLLAHQVGLCRDSLPDKHHQSQPCHK